MKRIKRPRLIVWVAKGMSRTGRSLKESLAAALPNKRVLLVRSNSKRFVQRNTDIILNWGNRLIPEWLRIYGPPTNGWHAVRRALNKLTTFKYLEGKVNIPEWTSDPDIARLWDDVVVRHNLTGFGGDGISLWNKADAGAEGPFPDAPLYTKYKKKKHEYRVHVFNGKVIDICMKRKRRDWPEEINTKIRNMDGGWIFARDDIFIPDDLEDQAIRAVDALGLDFGAVDVIWNKRENKSYVLEVNTAPGLIGTSLSKYTQAIKEIL